MIQELESQKKEMFLNLNYNSIKSKKLKEFLQEIQQKVLKNRQVKKQTLRNQRRLDNFVFTLTLLIELFYVSIFYYPPLQMFD